MSSAAWLTVKRMLAACVGTSLLMGRMLIAGRGAPPFWHGDGEPAYSRIGVEKGASGEKMRYQYLLVDNDDTLMDFAAAEGKALKEALRDHGLPNDDAVCESYHHINRALWDALEHGETTQARLKLERFAQLVETYRWPGVQAERLARAYEERLSTHAELLPGALHLLESLHGRMKIALVSNGVSAIQRGRLSRCPFTPLLDAIMISEEIGVSKPDPAMVISALKALGCADRKQAVFLGDSLTADVAAAKAAGIDCIWLNLHGKASDAPTYEARSLAEAEALLLK